MLFGLTNQCFTKDALVSTETGLRPIEEIQIGDYVWSEDTETGKKELKQVTDISATMTSVLVYVTTEDGTTINTTENHPFYVEGKGWCAAAELQVGDICRTKEGQTEVVAGVTVKQQEEPVTVYNLTIEDNHTYYVSVDEILVHNQCEFHHLASDKSKKYKDRYAELFGYAGKDLQYEKNIIPLEDHKGGHTIAYKEWVLKGLEKYLKPGDESKNKELLDMVLDMITKALKENNRLPYKDGKDALDDYSWDTGW